MTAPRQPEIIAGAMREHVERLQRLIPESTSLDRLAKLLDELDAALVTRQFENSLAMVQK